MKIKVKYHDNEIPKLKKIQQYKIKSIQITAYYFVSYSIISNFQLFMHILILSPFCKYY